MTVLECSTGNAGIGCSFVSAVKGYPCIIVMPEGMSEERKKLDVAYGAQMVYTPGGESDVDLALEKLEQIRRKDPKTVLRAGPVREPRQHRRAHQDDGAGDLGADGRAASMRSS